MEDKYQDGKRHSLEPHIIYFWSSLEELQKGAMYVPCLENPKQ